LRCCRRHKIPTTTKPTKTAAATIPYVTVPEEDDDGDEEEGGGVSTALAAVGDCDGTSVGCSPSEPVGATDVTAVDGVGAPVVGVVEMKVGTLTGVEGGGALVFVVSVGAKVGWDMMVGGLTESEVGGVVGPPVGKSVGALVGGDVGAAVIVTLHPSYPAPDPAQQSSYM